MSIVKTFKEILCESPVDNSRVLTNPLFYINLNDLVNRAKLLEHKDFYRYLIHFINTKIHIYSIIWGKSERSKFIYVFRRDKDSHERNNVGGPIFDHTGNHRIEDMCIEKKREEDVLVSKKIDGTLINDKMENYYVMYSDGGNYGRKARYFIEPDPRDEIDQMEYAD